jgi:hypothetical protein
MVERERPQDPANSKIFTAFTGLEELQRADAGSDEDTGAPPAPSRLNGRSVACERQRSRDGKGRSLSLKGRRRPYVGVGGRLDRGGGEQGHRGDARGGGSIDRYGRGLAEHRPQDASQT